MDTRPAPRERRSPLTAADAYRDWLTFAVGLAIVILAKAVML